MSHPELIGSIVRLVVGRLFKDGSFTECGICAETGPLEAGFCNKKNQQSLSGVGNCERGIYGETTIEKP